MLYTITFRIASLNFSDMLTNHLSTDYVQLYNSTSRMVSHSTFYTTTVLNVSHIATHLVVVVANFQQKSKTPSFQNI